MQTKGQLMKSLHTAFSFAPPSILSLTIYDRDLHALRAAVLLYHKSAIYDRDLYSLRSAVLLYHQ